MAYRVELLPAAERDLDGLTDVVARAFDEIILGLKEEPRPETADHMRNLGSVYKIRVGKYRMAWAVSDEDLLVTILVVADRKQVYDIMRRRLG